MKNLIDNIEKAGGTAMKCLVIMCSLALGLAILSCDRKTEYLEVGVAVTYHNGEKDTIDFTLVALNYQYIKLNDKGCVFAGSYYDSKVCGVRIIDKIITYNSYKK